MSQITIVQDLEDALRKADKTGILSRGKVTFKGGYHHYDAGLILLPHLYELYSGYHVKVFFRRRRVGGLLSRFIKTYTWEEIDLHTEGPWTEVIRKDTPIILNMIAAAKKQAKLDLEKRYMEALEVRPTEGVPDGKLTVSDETGRVSQTSEDTALEALIKRVEDNIG